MSGADSTATRIAVLAVAALSLAPAARADDLPELCSRLVAIADAGNGGAAQRVRLVWIDSGRTPKCLAKGSAARPFCHWLLDKIRRQVQGYSMLTISQDSLDCLGHAREPGGVADDGSVLLHAWFSGGTWEPVSYVLARDHASFSMDLNLGTKPPYSIDFSASPK